MTLDELIEKSGGTLVQGDSNHAIEGVTVPEWATPTDLVFAAEETAALRALASNAGAVVLRAGLVQSYPAGKCIIEVPNPKLWFARARRLLTSAPANRGVHPAAVVAPDVQLGEQISIGAGAVVDEGASIGARTQIDSGAVIGKGVAIGEDSHIYPRAVIYPGSTLGNRVMVHAGAVLGADGFGYVRDEQTGAYTQFPQQGTLVIEDDVEIGANSTIDRGALEETRIRRGAKIDNLVHIGHNCDIGEDVILVSLTGISGSSIIGKGAVLAGQVGIGDHAHVGPGVILGGQAGVLSGKTVTNDGHKPGTVLWGTPARPLPQALREIAAVTRLAKRQRKNE